jgi:hypothetical protein
MGSGNHQSPAFINALAARGEALTSGSSAYSKEHMFSFENFANLVSDVALQWGQQKYIAKASMSIIDKSKIDEANRRAKMLYDLKSKGRLEGLAKIPDEERKVLLDLGMKEEDLWKQTTLG